MGDEYLNPAILLATVSKLSPIQTLLLAYAASIQPCIVKDPTMRHQDERVTT